MGGDLFWIIGEYWSSLFCSRRFVELAFERKWTHFYFQAMDILYGPERYECRINPGKLKGPPQWYPENFVPHAANIGPMPEPYTNLLAKLTSEVIPEELSDNPAIQSMKKWEPPVDSDEGEPTGLELLGEPVRWQYEDPEWTNEERGTVRGLILPFLEPALKTAGDYLRRQHADADEEEPLEVWQVGVALAPEQPEAEAEFHWEINIAAHHAGVCPSHFLTFRGSQLIDATAAD